MIGFFAQAAASQAELDYYATSAQVIPVLLLALAFEFRGTGMVFVPSALEQAFRGGGPAPETETAAPLLPWWASVYTALVSFSLFLGEAAAIYVLANEAPAIVPRFAVAGALLVSGLAIIGPIVLLQLNASLAAFQERRNTRLRPITKLDRAFVWLMLLGVLGVGLLSLPMEFL